jgi:spore coat protein A, manganese oxidase
MVTRRRFLQVSAVLGAGLLVPLRPGSSSHAAPSAQTRIRRNADARPPQKPKTPVPGGTLDPLTIPKYQTPLIIPPAMPRTGQLPGPTPGETIDYYEIAVRQFQQQILPPSLPATTVWSYGSTSDEGTFNYPAFTLETSWKRPVQIKWINDLKDRTTGHFLPHLFAVDQTLHWANPPGPRDMHGMDPTPYTGPVPAVTHVHGAHVSDESDGYAEAWYLPAATNIPPGYATEGTWYETFRRSAFVRHGIQWEPGSATFHYPNVQRATTLWYHDHTLGMTRLNVYAGPAGFYLLRGGPDDLPVGVLPGPAPALGDPAGTRYHEIPIAIQDRSFNNDGALFFPTSREFFDGFTGPYAPDSDVAPIWNPEFFGNTMVVNGRTWPVLEVEPRRYRFRFLDGCNARTLILEFNNPALKFWQIGTEGGFLPAPVQLSRLLIAPAERADVIVDFTGFAEGSEIILLNVGPDMPFQGGEPGADFPPADPDTSGQVMKFRIGPLAGPDTSTPVRDLTLPALTGLGVASVHRQVSLNELDSAVISSFGPIAAMLGTVNDPYDSPSGTPVMWMEPITENPDPGATEVWEIYNFTVDAHPIHIHQVMFQVMNREVFDPSYGTPGTVHAPNPWETGYKDTVIALPGQITRFKARFDLAGLYVWHCHIIDHEDNEMMRPFAVGPIPKLIEVQQVLPLIQR